MSKSVTPGSWWDTGTGQGFIAEFLTALRIYAQEVTEDFLEEVVLEQL